MLLLTKEEIIDSSLAFGYDYEDELGHDICRAQIKKIAKWGDGECPHRKLLKRECYDCWQVLREII